MPWVGGATPKARARRQSRIARLLTRENNSAGRFLVFLRGHCRQLDTQAIRGDALCCGGHGTRFSTVQVVYCLIRSGGPLTRFALRSTYHFDAIAIFTNGCLFIRRKSLRSNGHRSFNSA